MTVQEWIDNIKIDPSGIIVFLDWLYENDIIIPNGFHQFVEIFYNATRRWKIGSNILACMSATRIAFCDLSEWENAYARDRNDIDMEDMVDFLVKQKAITMIK